MITAQVLDSDALLNDFDVINTLEFISGEALHLVMRLTQPQRIDQLRFIPPLAAKVTVHLPNKDGSMLDVEMTGLVQDKSIWSGDISAADSENLYSGNFTFDLDLLGDGTKIIKGFVENGLSLIITGAC